MNWFGASWGAPCNETDQHAPTPVGAVCVECEKTIGEDDQGFMTPFIHGGTTTTAVYHRICFLRTVIPCEMWSDEMKQDMPQWWADHMAEHHSKPGACP